MTGFTRRTLLAVLGLLPFSHRARTARPSSYCCEIPAFARYLEFPDGTCRPIGDCLDDPDITWDGSCFVHIDPTTGIENRLPIVDRVAVGPVHKWLFSPSEIEILPDGSFAWNIPAAFCAAVREGKRSYLKHVPQGMLIAAILGCKFRFDDGQLRPWGTRS
jgi:hypothetical protein